MIKRNRVALAGVQFNSAMFLVLVFIASNMKPAYSQEMLGIVNSRYSGITGSIINPAVTVTSPFYLDINLVAADIFAENNYLYIPKEEYQFLRFISQNPYFQTHGPDNNLYAYDYYNKRDKEVYGSFRLVGPSFAVTVGQHSFGVVTGARAITSTKNLPYEMAKFIYEKLNYPPQNDINYIDNRNIYNAELAWAEIGINYSYVFKQKNLDYWAVGITIKDLLGYGGGYVYTENIDYVMLDRDTLIVHTINGQGGYSLPVNYQTNDYEQNPLFRGKGVGIDLGVIYQKKKRNVNDYRVEKLCAQNYVPYKYKIGVSLLDIGRVRFTQNAEKLLLENVSTYWPGIASTEFTSVRNFTNQLSNQFYGDTSQLIQGNEIKIALPTAISVQADLNYFKNWYINGTIVYPIQLSKSGLIRPVLFAVTPRYETALFEASLPITLYDWTKPRIGLSARFMGFFIGTEKISGFFHFTDFTGLDFYFGLKISLKKGFCHRNEPADNCGYNEYKEYIKGGKNK